MSNQDIAFQLTVKAMETNYISDSESNEENAYGIYNFFKHMQNSLDEKIKEACSKKE